MHFLHISQFLIDLCFFPTSSTRTNQWKCGYDENGDEEMGDVEEDGSEREDEGDGCMDIDDDES